MDPVSTAGDARPDGRARRRAQGRRMAGLGGGLGVLLLTAVCGGVTPTLTERQQEAVCSIGDRYGRLDMMPSGFEGMAVRVVTEAPDAAREGLRGTLTVGGEPALSIARIEEPRPKLAIVIDDLGLHPGQLLGLWSLGQPLTWALIPEAPYTPGYAEWLQGHGASMLIHLPMEPLAPEMMGISGYLREDQGLAERRAIIEDALEAVPGAIGFNNHMGSLLTTDRDVMREVIEAMPPDFLVLDSRTTATSQLARAAREAHRPVAERAVFLDNERAPERIVAQLEEALAIASERGSAVAIGHPYPETVEAIRAFVSRHGHDVHLVPIERVTEPPLLPPWLRSCPAGAAAPDTQPPAAADQPAEPAAPGPGQPPSAEPPAAEPPAAEPAPQSPPPAQAPPP
ncbi:MAG: divergent polysaccharide deacetylase family protein [Deltaproteobacteria bacterium]|nr:divergent polysaccharide deacetylase family protein [Deltaproteobacteria bacterium]MCB9785605.1 divergent polysaccharide deacetylase family protein [Deltaproteobacteria bacterium]